MSIARHEILQEWKLFSISSKIHCIATSISHHFIFSNMQTATASMSGLTRKSRDLLLSSWGDFVVPLVAMDGVAVVPERCDSAELMGAVMVFFGVGSARFRGGKSKKPGNRALSSAEGSGSRLFGPSFW